MFNIPESVFNIPGIRVQLRAESVFKILRNTHEQWIIRAGWLLVTRSGTTGRTTVCPEEWDEWAASEHILRIVPNEEKCPAGYLCTFLSSPLGQAQLTASIYGAVVDELTEELKAFLCPSLAQRRIEHWFALWTPSCASPSLNVRKLYPW